MAEKLIQQAFRESREFIIHDDRLEFKVIDHKCELTEFVHYEDIENDKIFFAEKSQPNYSMHVISRNAAIILFFCKIFGAIESWSWFLAALCSAIILFAIHVFTVKRYTKISTTEGPELILISDSPSEEEVTNYIEQVYSQRREYLRKNYFEQCSQDIHEAQHSMSWLLKNNIITKQEFESRLKFIKKQHD